MCLEGLFITWACSQAVASICCIFVLKQKHKIDEVDSNSVTGQEKEIANVDSTEEQIFDQEANEKTRLTKTVTTQAANQSQGHFTSTQDLNGWKIIKILDFWLFMIAFVIGSSLTKLFMSNIGTYLRSFKHEKHLNIIMSTGPWMLIVFKLIIGFISDIYVNKIPRLTFFIGVAVVNVPVFLAFIFQGDHIVFMYIVAYVAFISNGLYFLFGSVITADYFGVEYFAINFGSAYLVDGLLTLLLQFILGILYDANVSDVATHTCYGLHCYYVSSGILCALSIVTLATSVVLYIRRFSNCQKSTQNNLSG